MRTAPVVEDVLTIEQRENNLKKLDAVAGNVVSLATGMGSLNELGIWAGGVKAVEVVHAVVYSVPAFVLAIALALALESLTKHAMAPPLPAGCRRYGPAQAAGVEVL